MKLYYNKKGKVVGELKEGIYRKFVRHSKHFMIKYEAWGIDFEIFEDLKKEKCSEVRLKDTETGFVYKTTLNAFNDKGIVGFYDGKQVFLSTKHWEITK